MNKTTDGIPTYPHKHGLCIYCRHHEPSSRWKTPTCLNCKWTSSGEYDNRERGWEPMSELLTVKEAADVLCLGEMAVRARLKNGTLKGFKIKVPGEHRKDQWRIERFVLEAFIKDYRK